MPDSGLMQAAHPSSADRTVKVAIIEDVRSLREGIGLLIGGTPGFQCTGSFRTMEEALDKIRFDLPDVVLVDIGLPGLSG
ncbi:MAG TPA: response regulator, partial [Pyrinomonadaceae bacterium]|nr:response regulator [Pyrinomonadaceae bacterium]